METKYMLPEINTEPLQAVENQEMMPNTKESLPMQLVYPEIFYKLQPLIILVCDQLENYDVIPTQEMVDHVSNSIYIEVCQMYPDLVSYNFIQNNHEDPPFVRDFNLQRRDFDYDYFKRRFRKRGSLQDLISILLLSEIFRRL